MESSEVRQSFLDFFAERGHTIVPSSPVVLRDDPTLLFVNAGMNQFKDVFLGTGSRGYTRAADTQKCIRAGGKHNDLEDVGRDTYHHTFFEMLGNWSFGDYFKEEAIAWAWELLTKVWGLEPARLHVTYFEGDAEENLEPDLEARDLWARFLPPERIHPGNKKDNFWEMADTGPCGPCSEIHFDATDDLSGAAKINAEDPDVIEFWNLVFIQYNRTEDGTLEPLAANHVDTGMGFERIVRILQGKRSNYDTDVFQPLFEAIRRLTGAREYRGALEDPVDIAYRVLADHVRTLSFAVADGVLPSNEGRGYVLRRLLRRASRFARRMGKHDPVLWRLVEPLADTMGDVFPELRTHRETVERVIRAEEESFGQTLDRGIELFEEIVAGMKKRGESIFPGDDAFRLYDTYGFPVDLTALMAREQGFEIDLEGFEARMTEQRNRARAARKADREPGAGVEIFQRLQGRGVGSGFVGYDRTESGARILALVSGDREIDRAEAGVEIEIILDRTPFYPESGGQVADRGVVEGPSGRAEVLDVRRPVDGIIAHRVKVAEGVLAAGDEVRAAVSESRRRAAARHHTATHLLNYALRTVLGPSVRQAGSYVGPDRLRFDFTWYSALEPSQIEEIERIVNERIVADDPVAVSEMDYAEIDGSDIIAVFDERYGDRIRVVDIGGYSRELCGGTHLQRTGQAGFFLILSESALASGIRRIEAVAGLEALREVQRERAVLRSTGELLSSAPEEVPERVAGLLQQVRRQEKDLRRLQEKGAAGEVESILRRPVRVGDLDLYVADLGEKDPAYLRSLADAARARGVSGILLLGARSRGKAVLLCSASRDAVARGAHAGKIVRELASRGGGGGGGRPDLAQAGGRDVDALAPALENAASLVEQTLS